IFFHRLGPPYGQCRISLLRTLAVRMTLDHQPQGSISLQDLHDTVQLRQTDLRNIGLGPGKEDPVSGPVHSHDQIGFYRGATMVTRGAFHIRTLVIVVIDAIPIRIRRRATFEIRRALHTGTLIFAVRHHVAVVVRTSLQLYRASTVRTGVLIVYDAITVTV